MEALPSNTNGEKDCPCPFRLQITSGCCPNFYIGLINGPKSWSFVPLSHLHLLLKLRANNPPVFWITTACSPLRDRRVCSSDLGFAMRWKLDEYLYMRKRKRKGKKERMKGGRERTTKNPNNLNHTRQSSVRLSYFSTTTPPILLHQVLNSESGWFQTKGTQTTNCGSLCSPAKSTTR